MTPDHVARLVAELSRTPWALMPEYLGALTAALSAAAKGTKPTAGRLVETVGHTAESIKERFAARPARTSADGAVAVVPIVGILSQRGSFLDELFGGGSVSTQRLAAQIRQLGADNGVKSIILDVDSPGGSVGGLEELSDAIFALRRQKRVVAVANSLMASAAYWIGSAASEIVATPESQAGSIGVWTAHFNQQKMLEDFGVDVTLISAGKYKVEGNPFEPLGDEARAFIQDQVNKYHELFLRSVARNRSAKTLKDVRDGYGEGRALIASDALAARLIDRVGSLDEVVRVESARPASKPAMQGLAGGFPRLAHALRQLQLAELDTEHGETSTNRAAAERRLRLAQS